MSKFHRSFSFRYRLTLWYIAVFSISLLAYQTFSYFELKANLISQMDAGLLSAMDQTIQNLDVENGNLALQNVEKTPIKPLSETQTALRIRILDADGNVIYSASGFPAIPIHQSALHALGDHSKPIYQTIQLGTEHYRVVTAVLIIAGTQTKNFLQIANSLSNIDKELSSFIVRFLVGLPFILLIAAAGGLFLANTALKPIVAMQHLAEHVREDRLSDRLHYQGPSDEFGSLAATFDSMLDRLEASFAREKRFSADAAHELKTPLTALKGKLEVALSRPRTAKEYEEALTNMKGDVERLISLSADLLLLSRMGNVALSSRAEKIDVGELLDSCVDQIITAFPDKHVTVKRDYAHHVEIEGVRDYLVRLFLNILDNAVKFSNTEVMLSISIKQVQARKAAVIEISDNGHGIPKSEIPFLFQPFYRVESDRSRLHGGAGLGLAIAHEIAEAHGGQIEISSVVGEGTRATVALPLSLKQ